jgi:hypothetical protein
MFSRKHIIQNAQQNFFLPEERIEFKGMGCSTQLVATPMAGSCKIHQTLPNLRRLIPGSLSARLSSCYLIYGIIDG